MPVIRFIIELLATVGMLSFVVPFGLEQPRRPDVLTWGAVAVAIVGIWL